MNPIIPGEGICDPHVHIFENNAWLYATHDRSRGNPTYRMDDWHLYSSPDLVNWKLEFVLRPEDTFLGKCEECWATDAAYRNGKYYYYFSHQQYETGVAVSENGPAGPYKDVLGSPLLPKGLADTASYDPTVFIDDDENKTPYITWGHTASEKHYYIARLNEDMISLAEEPRKIVIEDGWRNDASCIHKREGLYYLNSHGSSNAVSKCIYGPYKRRPRFCFDSTVDHGGFFSWHNQTFFTYGIPDGDHYFRQSKIVYAHYKDNGDIVSDPFISHSPLGVGQYDAGWDEIEAKWYFAASDSVIKKETSTWFELQNLCNDSWVSFPKVQNMTRNMKIEFHCACKNADGCRIEIRSGDTSGPLLGECDVPATGTFFDYTTVSVVSTNDEGVNDLCFVIKGGDRELLRLRWFRLLNS